MPITDKIILVDEDSRRRAAISHLIGGSDMHVEPFETCRELRRRWPAEGAILCYDDGVAVADVVADMARDAHWMPLVAYAPLPTTGQVVRAVSEGASDFLNWPFTVEEVRRAVANAAEGHRAVASIRLREASARGRIQRLTPREREVLTGVASGLSNRSIGERLSISPRTVEIHRANMLNKIGASHTSEAIRIAIEASLVR